VSRYHSHINSAAEIVSAYKGIEPFAFFLKKFFSANNKFGSKDRKAITHLCYCHFRIGKLFAEATKEERFLLAVFLCSQEPNELLQNLKPGWNEKVLLPLNEKLKLIDKVINPSLVFPFIDELSAGIEADEFVLSHFIQPDLFLRIRPGQYQNVLNKLTAAGILFDAKNEDCIAVPNSTKIEQVVDLNKEAVVQDYSSQRVGELMQRIKNTERKISLWDCCAASGGKSIMAKDLLGEINLAVSDIRESILINLKKRFAEAGIKNYKSFLADLSVSSPKEKTNSFDFIIADVPCSGSGTWGRTPEQLSFFQKQTIEQYSSLQKKILSNVIPSLKNGGALLYITCSVFNKENEEVVNWIETEFNLITTEMKLLKGYNEKADSMFAALLRKTDVIV
jgi:16S rRNA (cytosine967-C5)-methyltransferase